MGCGSSSAAPAGVIQQPAEPNVSTAAASDAAVVQPVQKEDPTVASVDLAAPEDAKKRRDSARTRVVKKCSDGWLEAAESYIAGMEAEGEWPTTEEHEALLNVAGANFQNAVVTFEQFDVDGDRHIQIDELASALEQMGE
jgi:hypothetical protein